MNNLSIYEYLKQKDNSAIFQSIIPQELLGLSIVGGNKDTAKNKLIINRFLSNELSDLVSYKGVDEIRDYLYAGCDFNGMQILKVPEGIRSIGKRAFCNCSALTRIELPESLESIGTEAFFGNVALQYINIPNNVLYIPDRMCERDGALQSCVFPTKIISIGESAFNGCNFSTVRLQGVQRIKSQAFRGNFSLNSLTIDGDNTIIESYAFSGCFNLKDIILKNIYSIGDHSFFDCRQLSSLHIPASVQSISSNAFEACHALNSIIIHKPENSIEGAPWGASNNSLSITWEG